MKAASRISGVETTAKTDMGTRRKILWAKTPWVVALLTTLATTLLSLATMAASAADEGSEGLRLHIDNDLFAGGAKDRDYTGGMALTVSGESARDGLLSLDSLLRYLDPKRIEHTTDETHYAHQVGLIAFTPADIITAAPVHDDRPYASLLFTSNGRISVDIDGRGAWSSSLTVGMLGLESAGELHAGIHEMLGSEPVHGYANQISAGGEPTARYTIARHHLWVANASSTLDVKTTVQGSVGFLTETSAAISMRIGRFDTPWWSFAPELTDYIGAPTPIASSRGQSEMYFFAGARMKARAYNAFLQGQFRDSAVEYSSADIEPLIVEGWLGFVTQVFDNTQLSYTLNYQTSELRVGKADRDALWGGVQVTHSF